MKIFLLLSFVIPALLLDQQPTDAIMPGKYIEIDYIGQHWVKPLLIYKEKSELEILKKNLTKRFDSLKQIIPEKRLLTEEEKMREVNTLFEFIMTDKQTYKKISNFIQTHDYLFTSGIKYEGFKIISTRKIYYISYKQKDEFFEQLKKYLTIQNCDKEVIQRINVIAKGA